MCLHPKTLINPTYSFAPGFSKTSVNTQCGQCLECQQNIKDDWFIRNYAQFKDTTANGGCCYFLTLTYAETPRFSRSYFGKAEDSHDIFECDIDVPCFSLDHIQTFTKNLQKYAKRRYGKHMSIKHMIFPEYGSRTKRPHYHCLFYTSHYISPQNFYRLVDGYENDTKRKKGGQKWDFSKPYFKTRYHDGAHERGAWTHGWVLVSKPSKGGMTVKNYQSIKYCAKYATKDMSFYNLPEIKHYLSSIHDKSIYPDHDERVKLNNEFSKFSTRHRQSPSLGFNWLFYKFQLQYDDIIKNGFKIDFDLTCKSYRLPEYYKRKILYRYVKNGDRVKWLYSSSSLPYHIAYYENAVLKTINNLKHCTSLDSLDKFTCIEHEGYKYDKAELKQFFSRFLREHSFRDLARFKVAYSGRNYQIDDNYTNNYIYDIDCDWFLRHARSQYLTSLNNLKIKDVGFSILKGDYGSRYIDNTYDTLPCFHDFSKFLTICEKIGKFFKNDALAYRDFIDDYSELFKDNSHNHDMPENISYWI